MDITTTYGLEEKKRLKPFQRSEKDKLIKELHSVTIIIESMKINEEPYKEIGRIFCKMKDIRNSLKRCAQLETLDDVELYEIKYFAMLMGELIENFDKTKAEVEEIRFHQLGELITLLDPEGKLIPTFHVYDKYSEKLKEIREKKRQKENEIFAETDEEKTSKLKEERLELVVEEEAEELRIRKGLTESINKHISDVEENIRSVGKLDFLIAKARLAMKYNGTKPEIQDRMEIHIEEAFNPEIFEILSKKEKRFTPVSIGLNSGTTVITGANMGGKSVTLKTIVLNLLLGQMGFFVFCKSARFPILDFIQFISDDMQSISKGLSTFGAEIIKLKEVLGSVKQAQGFVALDEFARGTNPKEGFYLVKSLCKYLNKFESISLISTHYDGVVEEEMDHYQVIGLKNVNFEALKHKIDLNKKYSIELIQENMDYKLEKVSKENAVPKDALNISMLLGLDEELIGIAKQCYKIGDKE